MNHVQLMNLLHLTMGSLGNTEAKASNTSGDSALRACLLQCCQGTALLLAILLLGAKGIATRNKDATNGALLGLSNYFGASFAALRRFQRRSQGCGSSNDLMEKTASIHLLATEEARNRKIRGGRPLVETSASLLGTSALLLVTSASLLETRSFLLRP